MGETNTVGPKGSIQSAQEVNPTTDVVDLYMHVDLNSGSLLAVDAAIDAATITLAPGHGAVAGNVLVIQEAGHFYQGTVLNVVVNDVDLDTPLDHNFTAAAAEVCVATTDLRRDGSVTPVIAHIKPAVGVWVCTRLVLHIEGTGSMDSGKFGNAAPLTKGIVFRAKNGHRKNLFNMKTNGDFAERAFDVGYDDRAAPGLYAFRGRRTFAGVSKNGTTINLDAGGADEFQLIIQDDLSSLSGHVHLVVQGHVKPGSVPAL